ncbi:bromodomain testis-specific protein [Scaptodrosophila lebanonensis]|uniref:Bromodomain testis-specific protein n=1 Tax=Drosophila lebanonensis TaxID=7225 RepID=A0A6J2UGV0_DROLE|nr:bromodomain testis-specific protein [Scaptodrosophila lebanonensis]
MESMYAHRKQLKMSAELSACRGIIKKLFSSRYKNIAWIFYEPIEPQLLGLTDYFEIVKEPMDLSTVKHRLSSGYYLTATDFAKDVRLIFFNTYLYTNPTHVCYGMAVELQHIFEGLFSKLQVREDDQMRIKRKVSDADSECDSNETSKNVQISLNKALSDEPNPPLEAARKQKTSFAEKWGRCFEEQPLTAAEDLDLHGRVQQLDGEVLLKVIHMIHQLEGLNTTCTNKELEFDVGALKTHTKRTILSYLASKGITGKRARISNYKYQ